MLQEPSRGVRVLTAIMMRPPRCRRVPSDLDAVLCSSFDSFMGLWWAENAGRPSQLVKLDEKVELSKTEYVMKAKRWSICHCFVPVKGPDSKGYFSYFGLAFMKAREFFFAFMKEKTLCPRPCHHGANRSLFESCVPSGNVRKFESLHP